MKIKENWVAWEELLPGFTPATAIDFRQVGGMAPGSIPFADATGFLTQDNANFFWDETNHWLGIGTDTRQGNRSRLHLVGPDGVVAGAYYDNFSALIVEANNHCYIQITSPSTHYGSIWFNDNAAAGGIRYNHADDEMDFFIDGTMAFRIDAGGISVNKADVAATNPLTVFQVGTDIGFGDGVGGVVARFRADEAKHTKIAIDARSGYDPILALSTDAHCQWDLRFDNSEANEFQIRYQGGNGAFQNRADFQIDVGGNVSILTGHLNIMSRNELRFYDNGNYVGFEAPALGADQIWVLPATDGPANECWGTDGGGNIIWRTHDELAGYVAGEHMLALDEDDMASDSDTNVATQQSIKAYVDAMPGGGDVTAAANMADHAIVRGDGGAKGVQDSGVIIDDADNVTGMVTLTLPNEGLHILDTNASHDLIIKAGSDISADRILSFVTGDAARTITLSGNPTLADWFDQAVKAASNVNFGTIGCGTITVADGSSINLQEDITFTGATTENLIKFPDALANALSFMEGANPYLTFITTNGSEAVSIVKTLKLGTVIDAGVDTDKFLVLDAGGNVDFRTGAEVLADIGGGGGGDVTAAAVLADHTLIRGDGGAKGIQDTGINIDDNDNITFPDGASINLQEDITFLGATTENLIKFPDNLPDALSFMEGANPYQTFITTNGSEAIQFHEDVLLKASTEYGVGNKTTGAWAKSIGGGGDYADWATMIAAMPDLIAHAVTVTIKKGTTLTETCNLKNKHGLTTSAAINVVAERYYPTAGAIPTADSATATTLRDAALAAEAYGNDYFNGNWILIVAGTGSDDNGFVLITDYVDATGDVVVAAWPGTEPDNTSRYIIVGALIDGGSARANSFVIDNNTVAINFYGIGVRDTTDIGVYTNFNTYFRAYYCGIYNAGEEGIHLRNITYTHLRYCGFVKNGNTGIEASGCDFIELENNGISDNVIDGVGLRHGSYAYLGNNFGDNNGAWGTHLHQKAHAEFGGTECSGASGNHQHADGDFKDVMVTGTEMKPGQPSFLVYNSTGRTNVTGDGTWVDPVIFDTEVFDQGGDFAANIFTADDDGRYLLEANLLIQQVDGTVSEIRIWTSNRLYRSGFCSPVACKDSNLNYTAAIKVIVDMDAGDTAKIQFIIAGGTKISDIAGGAELVTYFSGALIC